LKKIILFFDLDFNVNPFGLKVVIAPIGMFDLNSTLTLTTSVKWALNPFNTCTKTFYYKDTNSSNDEFFFE